MGVFFFMLHVVSRDFFLSFFPESPTATAQLAQNTQYVQSADLKKNL